MKQTILSKCFGKMKRVALTLFAALCVGSVWAEEGETTTPEVTPDTDPTPSTPALTIDPSAGYIVRNLGELGDQVAVVFTNDAAIATWKAPKNLKNVEFLAVGGGGGGGGHYFKGTSSTTKKYNQGGSGGGGGAVVTGFINELSANATVKIEVGDGGDKGSKTTDPAQPTAAENGGKSVITIDDVVYITAFGGGGDGGFASSGVAIGGSNSGSRGRYEGSTASIAATALANVEYIGAGADVSNVVCMRNKGSDGYQTNSGAPGGGGGGAISAGIVGRSSGEGGRGGDGYESDITGEIKVYGSGGGGGLGKSASGTAVVAKGGVGAGSAYADGKAAGHALANQGGGGAGGSFKQDGGNGGSGIVVLRFAYFESDISVDVAGNIKTKISSKAYTGDAMTSGLVSTYAYEVVELTSDLINPGEKKVRVTLNDGYFWSDGDTNKSKVFNWYIATIEAMDNGYKVVGLGEKGDEVALVFTNHAQEITWTVPKNLRNVEFLAVGGGGAGGADGTNGDKWTGGVGGGGGGVVVGSVANLASGANVIIKVGVGGKHGKVAHDPIGNKVNDNGMATAFASDSYFKVDGTVYVTAKAGGSDLGFENGGQDGGSGAGGRSASALAGKAIDSFIIQSDNVSGEFFGNDGGESGSYSCGGGGGATTPGVKADGGFGHGGQGFESWITGKRVVYGSGGGGGSAANANGGKGGEGAGNGNQVHQGAGSDALPNQGGGGGGGGGGQGLSGEQGRGGDGGSGIVVLRYSVYAAEVDGVPYATLADAFAAVEDGATVKLLNDVTLAEKITVKKAVTLDLNGCTLSETVTDSYGAIYIGTAGNLTITDSATGGKIATDGGIVIGNYGTVTVAGGTIEAGAVAEEDASIYNFYYNGSTYGKLTVTGGKLGRIWNCGNANITAGEVVDIDNSGAMTIADATTVSDTEILLNKDAPEVPNAATIITDKELNVITTVADYVVEKVDGVYKLKYTKTYTVTLPTAPANTVWYYNGQEVTGPIYAVYGSDVTITLKPAEGCSFSDGAAELTVIEISAIGEDTTVTLDNVTVPEAFQVVAKIGDTPYASLQAAYAAAEAESTIVLCKDVTGAGLVIDKSVTIDFGGNTYTFNDGVGNVPSNGFQILNGNTVTLKNGELNVDAGSADKFYTLIQNYANLTVEDMVLDGTNLDKWSKTDGDSYVLSNNSGTVLIQGATSITANDDGDLAYAFDVCKYKTYAIPTVTLNTTGTIAGKVEVSGGDFVYEAGTIEDAIVFTSGSVKGEVEDALTIPEDKKLVLNEAGAYVLADKIVVAKVGDNLFETIAEAFAAAQAGDTVVLEKSLAVNEVLQIPANVTLDLNGNELQALAVVGKLSMNGGALKTWDANTQTYFFMAAPAGALYQTSDAVMTIGADYALSLDGGSVTLPASWRTLLGQSLTIKSGASFVIPTGVELNLRGNAVVEDGATLTCDGTIALGNTYDAIDTSATLTSAQLAEGKVVSAVEGYRPVYANGVYSLKIEFVAQVGNNKYETLATALAENKENANVTIELIADIEEDVSVPAGFAGKIDLGGKILTGKVSGTDVNLTIQNGSIIHAKGGAPAVKVTNGTLVMNDVYLEANYHGVVVDGTATGIINGGTYKLTNGHVGYGLIYPYNANASLTVNGGEFYGPEVATDNAALFKSKGSLIITDGYFQSNAGKTIYSASGNILIEGGTFVGLKYAGPGPGIVQYKGGSYSEEPIVSDLAKFYDGYKAVKNEETQYWTVVASWTAPMPDLEEGDSFSGDYEYTSEVLSALEAKAATSVDVKVNGVELKGDEAIKALNTAVASFDDALTFDGTAASLDIEIKVTAVNTEDPAASTVVVTRGTEELTVKATPTVKYFYPETKTWGSDKPESGAVLFKIVF